MFNKNRLGLLLLGGALVLVAPAALFADEYDPPSSLDLSCQFLTDQWQKTRPQVPVPFSCQIISDPDPFPIDEDQRNVADLVGVGATQTPVGDDEGRVDGILVRFLAFLSVVPLDN